MSARFRYRGDDGSWPALGLAGAGEESLDATTEVKEDTGDDGTEALEEKQAGARIDVCVGLTLE